MTVLTPVRSVIILQVAPILVAVCAIGFSLLMSPSANGQSPIFLFALLFYCVFASVWLVQLLRGKIVVSDKGLESIDGNERRFFTWEELTRIIQTDAGRILADFSGSTRDLPNHKKWVDLTPYLDKWNGSPIQIQVQKFAPHVKLPHKFKNRIIAPYWLWASPMFIYLFTMLLVGLSAGSIIVNRLNSNILSELLAWPGGMTWLLAHIGAATGLLQHHTWLIDTGDEAEAQAHALSLYLLPITSTFICILFFAGWLWASGEDMASKLQTINRSERAFVVLVSGVSIIFTAVLQDKIFKRLLTNRK